MPLSRWLPLTLITLTQMGLAVCLIWGFLRQLQEWQHLRRQSQRLEHMLQQLEARQDALLALQESQNTQDRPRLHNGGQTLRPVRTPHPD
jgi:hypothetical protein